MLGEQAHEHRELNETAPASVGLENTGDAGLASHQPKERPRIPTASSACARPLRWRYRCTFLPLHPVRGCI